MRHDFTAFSKLFFAHYRDVTQNPSTKARMPPTWRLQEEKNKERAH
ncbi:hypothetical protein PUN28_015932 [Cardiocondyla obscurior]|uniref:Uncharacterized protein n=1 Tax=Cardiocondyla obscurior TaxID=286306 RepID=A0AAW2ESK6_9HYME